jgi:competence protein ComEA
MNDSNLTLAALPTAADHRRPRWAALLTTLVAACAIWFLQPHRANAAPRPSLAATAAAADPAADDASDEKAASHKKTATGKLNLNTATPEQLMLLPGVGPSKAEQIVSFRGKHGPFKRVADLRKVKGFGYKTLKKLEPFLDVKGETTLAGS